MEGHRFDELTRELAVSATRRRVLAGLAGGLATALGLRRAGAQGCAAYGRVCAYSGCCTTPGADCVCYRNGHCRCLCPAGTAACAGNGVTVCVDLRTDLANCGACGAACAPGALCVEGACRDCGVPGLPCCTGTACDAGLRCIGNECVACGAPPHPCCEGDVCTAPAVCVQNFCQ